METSVNNKCRAFTSLEQSKKLVEILPLESADMCWFEGEPFVEAVTGYEEERAESHRQAGMEMYPCWSLAALMNLLPSEFTTKGKYSETTYKIDIRKYALTDDVDIYQIAYGNYKFYEDGSHSWHDMINTGEKENLLDAAFQMICWIKENNLL